MESAGMRLKKIRLEKGFSLEEARKKTKIHLNILKAIEEDSLTTLSPVYIKGFLKIYCKFLGVSPKDYIDGYQEPGSAVTAKEPLSASLKLSSFRTQAKKIKAVLIFALVVIFVWIALFNLGKKTQKTQSIMPKPKPKSEISTGIRLAMRAKEDCLVYLKVDGRVFFNTVLKKGKSETWQAKEKIEFSLGNAAGVELELNGKSIPTLGKRGQAIKNILITKEQGLVVPR